jgi:hypothetical protein
MELPPTPWLFTALFVEVPVAVGYFGCELPPT